VNSAVEPTVTPSFSRPGPLATTYITYNTGYNLAKCIKRFIVTKRHNVFLET